MAATFLVGIQLARGLGVQGYGQYGIAMATISLVSIPGEFGLPKLVTREVAAAAAQDDLPRLFGVIRWANRTSMLIALPAAALMALGAYFFMGTGSRPVFAAILLGSPMVCLIALAKVRGAALQGLHFIVLGQVPATLLRPLLFSLLLLLVFSFAPNAGPASAMALNSITAVAILVVAQVWLVQRLPGPRPRTFSRAGRGWLGSAFPLALTDGIRVVQAQLTIVLLGLLAAPDQVGLFRIASATAIMVTIPTTFIGAAASPVVARLHAEADIHRLRRLSNHATQAMAAGVIGLTLPLVLLGPGLLAFVFGPDFAPAYPAMLVLCFGYILNACFGLNVILLIMSGHERRVTRAFAISLFIGIAAMLCLVPWFGMLGAAIASILFLTVWNVIAWRDARRILAVDTFVLAPLFNARRDGGTR